MGPYFPDRGWSQRLLHRKHAVLTSRFPGKSPGLLLTFQKSREESASSREEESANWFWDERRTFQCFRERNL